MSVPRRASSRRRGALPGRKPGMRTSRASLRKAASIAFANSSAGPVMWHGTAYGARVAVNDAGVATDGAATEEEPAAEVEREINDAGGVAVARRGDIADATVADALVQLALETWGRVDIVINNAGFGRPRMVFN